jgi:DHA1 family bicyclomycin/chloramphenicol resistance-like MFS transporter
MKGRQRFVVILILGLLSAIGPFSIDMYLPGFPAIAKDLHTSVGIVSYSLASFFIGICIGQLICGPLLDRFGRKMPLYVGMIIYVLSSIGCALSWSIELLIVMRFFQALGGCVGIVAPRAIIRDIFPVEENAKIFSFMILILGVSPIIAPTVGSYVVAHFSWHIVFVILSLITCLIFIAVVYWLPESRQPDPTYSLKAKPILNNFRNVLKVPQFYTYALASAISSAGLYAYLASSPFVFMELFKTTEQQYGFIFSINAAGLILCSQLNNLLLRKYTSEQISLVTLSVQTAVGILLLLGTIFNVVNLYSTIVLISLFLSCQGLSFPNTAALSMAPFEKDAGSASALMGAMQMAIGALAAAAVGFVKPTTAIPMAAVMAGCVAVGLIILVWGSIKINKPAKVQDVRENSFDMIEKY